MKSTLLLACLVSLAWGRAVAQNVLQAPAAARQAFARMGYGMFIHFGAYSQMANGEWIMEHRKIPIKAYEQVAAGFYPSRFDARAIVRLAKEAGMSYITITAKHHDGFCLFNSALTTYDVMDHTDFKRDIIKEMAEACKVEGLTLCIYYSLLDWHHPDYFPRGKSGGGWTGRADTGRFERYVAYMEGQLTELLTNYGPIGTIWFDGEWDRLNADWQFPRIYNAIHKAQPNCLIGNNHHHAVRPGEDFQMFEQDLPGANSHGFIKGEASVSQDMPLEMCETMNNTWGYNATDANFKSANRIIELLTKSAGHGANLLLNVGPTGTGLVQPEFADTLRKVGRWLNTYGKYVYGQPTRSLYSWGVVLGKNVHVLSPQKEAVIIPTQAVGKAQSLFNIGADGEERPISSQKTRFGLAFLPEQRGVYVVK